MEPQFTLFTLGPELMNKRRRRDAAASYTSDIWDIENLDRIIENFLSEEATDESIKSELSNSGLSDQDHTEEVISPQKRSFSQIAHINNISKDPKKIRLPRVLNSDIRKKYPLMFINMLNMCDIGLIELFFKKYTMRSTALSKYIHFGPLAGNTPQIMDDPVKDKIKKEIQQPFVLKDVCLESLEDVTNFVILLALLSPDRIFKIKRSEVITRSDTYKTEVNIYFELCGTRVSHWTSIEVGEFLLSLRERHQISRQELIEQFYASLPRLKVPGPFASEGKFTLNIENGRDDLRITNIISDSVTLVSK